MTPQEAVAVLRRVLGEFHGEQVRVNPIGAPTTFMVARIGPTRLADAVTALAAIEREVQS